MGISNERGTVVVLVAVMLFLIFFCVALVVDVGHIHNVKIELQRAADAAALAGAQQIPDGTIVTSAVAMGGVNKVDNDAVVIDATQVEPGCWDETITIGETASERFKTPAEDPECTTNNAVKVTATRNVPHFFFFPGDDAVVTADAIAVSQTINPVFPLAVVACTTSTGQLWKLPDMTIAGITTFEFASSDDLVAWTSLTFDPASAQKINDLITDPEELDEFNSVIYGKNLDNDNGGIENNDVDPGVYPYNSNYEGCNPVGLDITCGLGRIDGKEIAAPEEFLPPPNLVNLDMTGGTYAPTSFDPLTDFGRRQDPGNPSGPRIAGALPRWYNLNNEIGLQDDDYFARILTQDGVLLNDAARLQDYYNGNGPFPLGTGDDRFRPRSTSIPTGGDLIKCGPGSSGCRPNYAKILQRAGYPQVYLTNGVATNLVNNFLEKIGAQNGTMSCSDEDVPPETLQALVLKSPVIYVGDCDDVTFNPSEPYNYVGMSKFLVTRIWVNNNGYDCPGSDLQADNEPGPLHMEGLQVLPVADDEEPNASLIRIFLVE